MMRRYGRLAVMLCLCALILGGCGGVNVPDVVEVPTISVDKDGKVTVWQVGEFDKAYYDLSELTAMAEREAAEYNAKKGQEGAVSVEKTEALEGSKVVVVFSFADWKSCTDFGENSFFYGTVKEADLNGFPTDVALKDVKDGTPYAGSMAQEGDKYLLITDMKADIYCAGRVAYISQGASVNEDGSIRPSEEDGYVYILLK